MAIKEIFHNDLTINTKQASGIWANLTLDDYLKHHVAERGDKVVMVDRKWRLTFRELDRLAHRIACGLYQHGLRSGDVISIQLPNWAEWLMMHCAASKIGAVTNSIGSMYRFAEVSYILNYAETKLFLIPDRYRNFVYTDMIAELWPKLPQLENVFVAGKEVPNSMEPFDKLLSTAWEDEVDKTTIDAQRPDPNMVATLMSSLTAPRPTLASVSVRWTSSRLTSSSSSFRATIDFVTRVFSRSRSQAMNR